MAHSYNIESFRCGCEFCADVPGAERAGEPAEDPRDWHLPVRAGRHHIVLSRRFDRDKVYEFVIRHMGGPTAAGDGWFRCGKMRKLDYDSDAAESDADPDDRDDPLLMPNIISSAKNVFRGVVLNLRGVSYQGVSRFAGRVGSFYAVWPYDFEPDGDDDEDLWLRYFEAEVVAEQRHLSGQKPIWNWNPYLWNGNARLDTAIISEDDLIAGAAAYKREFYDYVRLNLVCLRKLVDQRRAAPPGYLLIKGEFVKPRRTSRSTTSVDVGVVSKLCDRSTLPDVVFEAIVSFTGNLEPHRPWRKKENRPRWGSWTTLT